jgi:hypothetical protein
LSPEFCEVAAKLLGKISGSEGGNISSQDFVRSTLAKQTIVAKSHLVYDSDSLLRLIQQHLANAGLHEVRRWENVHMATERWGDFGHTLPLLFTQTARTLGREAHLGDVPDAAPSTQPSSAITLDGIVKQYLRDAHSKCLAPLALCPPVVLTEQHVCPPPSRTGRAPMGLHARMFQTQRGTLVSE